MIDIVDKKCCSGCGACVEVCPTRAIAMGVDGEGFRYPAVDVSACISCGKCEKSCPFISPKSCAEQLPDGLLLADDDDCRRAAASSGGAFALLASDVIAAGGIVFGAALDGDWGVRHIGVERVADLSRLKGSKYVESSPGDSYARVVEALAAGRRVMFVGTPCQVAGLRRVVGKPHPLLLLVDVACHGVPSSMVWKQSLKEFCDKENISPKDITAIDFRDKVKGWKNYHFTITHTHGSYSTREFPYIMGFAHDLYLRPSCHACRIKESGSYADVTLADAWGIEQMTSNARFLDDRGVSFVMVHTDKGCEAVAGIGAATIERVDAAKMLQHNRSIVTSAPYTTERERFFALLAQGGSVAYCVAKAHHISPKQRLERLLTPLLLRLGIKGFTKKLKRK